MSGGTRSLEINEPLVVHDTIDGEILAIRNDTGVYFSMEATAADIWGAIVAGHDEATIAAELARATGASADEVDAAVAGFLDALVDQQLVRPAAGTVAGEAPIAIAAAAFTPPVLESYTDMQDLLLFDPIHEVSAEGWPAVVNEDGQAPR